MTRPSDLRSRLVTDAAELVPGDVVAIGTGWRIVVDVSPATHPAAEQLGATRVDVLGWESGRPMVLTWWPDRSSWLLMGTAESFGWVAP